MPSPSLKLQSFEAKWLFWELGWLTLRICEDLQTHKGFYIRGSTLSGSCDGTFDWGLYPTHKAARLALCAIEPEEAFIGACRHLGYTPHYTERF